VVGKAARVGRGTHAATFDARDVRLGGLHPPSEL
jgi:hypothetical protein